jgi:hypothetical protein
MPKTYLLSRTLDPLLGAFTGLLAYYLHETNPRSAPPPGHTLRELASWKWESSKQARAAREADVNGNQGVGDEWERMRREFESQGEGQKR